MAMGSSGKGLKSSCTPEPEVLVRRYRKNDVRVNKGRS